MNGALTIERIAERIDDAAEQPLAHRRVHNGLRAFDRLSFLDLAVIAESHDSDIVGFEIERHSAHAVLEFNHLAGLHLVQATEARAPVADRAHPAPFQTPPFLA